MVEAVLVIVVFILQNSMSGGVIFTSDFRKHANSITRSAAQFALLGGFAMGVAALVEPTPGRAWFDSFSVGTTEGFYFGVGVFLARCIGARLLTAGRRSRSPEDNKLG